MHLDVSSATMLVLRLWLSYSITVVRSTLLRTLCCDALSIVGVLPADLSAVDKFPPSTMLKTCSYRRVDPVSRPPGGYSSSPHS